MVEVSGLAFDPCHTPLSLDMVFFEFQSWYFGVSSNSLLQRIIFQEKLRMWIPLNIANLGREPTGFIRYTEANSIPHHRSMVSLFTVLGRHPSAKFMLLIRPANFNVRIPNVMEYWCEMYPNNIEVENLLFRPYLLATWSQLCRLIINEMKVVSRIVVPGDWLKIFSTFYSPASLLKCNVS